MAEPRRILQGAFRAGVYLSLVFLAIALYRAEYLVLPRIRSAPLLALSFALLFVGSFALALAWRQMLSAAQIRISVRTAVASIGLPIFAKYIPGKIWMIVGRAAYVADATGRPLREVSALSINAQLLTLWVGLTVGGFAMFGERVGWEWRAPVLGLFVGLGVLLFAGPVQRWAAQRLARRFERLPTVPILSASNAVAALPGYMVTWLLWSIGFHVFAAALCADPLHWSVAFAFPLAAALGILAIVVPGGLGVREGVLAALLSLVGLELDDATTIAVSQRLWFLGGEGFMFVAGLIARPARRGDVDGPQPPFP